MRALLAFSVGLCLAVSACGGGGGEEGEVRDAIRTFANAAIDGDGDKACEQLAKSARDQLSAGGQDCGEIFGSVADQFKDQAKAQLDQIDDLDVKVDGDKATVSGDGESTTMVKEDGEWKLSVEQ
jgi:hypothetical protein